jgi:S-DNA-T family DNA segregation ATPase FtsK/SpoIIIE
MYALAEAPSLLHNVPITVSLLDNWVLGIQGSQAKTLQMVIQLISYIAITHAYDDVKMVVLAPESIKKELAFTKYLQHFWDNERTVRFVAPNSSDVQVISKYFRDKQTQAENERKENFGNAMTKQPAYIVFALDKNLFEQSEIFKELLQDQKYRGFSFVPAFENVPKECTKLIDLRSGDLLIDLNDPDTADIALSIDTIDPVSFKKRISYAHMIFR